MKQIITTRECDAVARIGWDAIEAMARGESTPAIEKRAEIGLKMLGQGTRRMSAETNRVAVAFKIARASNASPEETKPLYLQLADASGPAIPEIRAPLASEQNQADTTKTAPSKKAARS